MNYFRIIDELHNRGMALDKAISLVVKTYYLTEKTRIQLVDFFEKKEKT